MSKMIETLHRGHRGSRPHLAVRSRAHWPRQLVGSARPTAAPDADGSPASPAVTKMQRASHATREKVGAQFSDPDDHAFAAYEKLLQQLHHDLDLSEPRCVCLTSAETGEGKTTTAINLAFAATQQAERRVLVVDANLACPQLAQRLGIQPKLGLSDLLVEGLFRSEAIDEFPLGRFDALTSGQPHPRAQDLLNSRRMDALLRDLKQYYDLVIVDAPHVCDCTDANMFAVSFDAVYLVVQVFWTRRDVVAKSLDRLRSAGVTVRGCILTHEGQLSDGPCDATRTAEDDLPAVPLPVPVNDFLSSPSETIAGLIPDAATTNSSLNAGDSAVDVSDLAPSQENSVSSSDSKECVLVNPMFESALETLQKLETIRPFDHVESHAEQERHSPVQADTIESDSVSVLETPPDRTSEQCSSVITGRCVEGHCDELAERAVRRRFRVHQSTPLSLESGQAAEDQIDRADDGTDISKDAWAANVLAVCGGLLILAGFLYVAVDMMFWF